MSQYLKGEKKETALDLIRKNIAYRMTNEEMISNLKDKGFEISERTLRRFKLEIRKTSGSNASEVYQHEIYDNVLEDILTIKELQREGWREYAKSKAAHDKLKALTLVRNTTLDKYKLYGKIPMKFKRSEHLRNAYDIITNSPGDDQKDLTN